MIFPLLNTITSPFGDRVHPISGSKQFHNGVDIRGKTGDKIQSPDSGTVVDVYSNSTGGNQLIIKHDNGYTTGYAHLSKALVKTGEKVTKGQVIGEVGATGNVTAAHLHFTLKDDRGSYIDPSKILSGLTAVYVNSGAAGAVEAVKTTVIKPVVKFSKNNPKTTVAIGIAVVTGIGFLILSVNKKKNVSIENGI